MMENIISISTLSSIFLHTIASIWPTSYNISELCQFAAQICNTLEYVEAFLLFRRRFDHFIDASLSRIIADTEAEKTLREHKKKQQEHAKQQSDSRKIVLKGGILTGREAAGRIESRHLQEMEQARRKTLLKNKREVRKTYRCQLDF